MGKTVGSLKLDKIIGRGSFGSTVYRGFCNLTTKVIRPVAVKRICKKQYEVNFLAIATLLLKVSGHPRSILHYFCTEEDKDFPYIASELCNGTLEDYLDNRASLYFPGELRYRGPRFDSDWQILHQVTQGLAYLHQIGIVHRDLKPTNILIFVIPSSKTVNNGNAEEDDDDDDMPQIKLADYGFSKILKCDNNDFTNTGVTNPAGTRGWMAPEVYLYDRIDSRVDIFALGCIFGYTLSVENKHPFGDYSKRILRIIQKQPMVLTKKEFKAPYSRDDAAIKLIQSMLKLEPEKRPTVQEVLQNVFFKVDPVRTKKLLDACQSYCIVFRSEQLWLEVTPLEKLLKYSLEGLDVNAKSSNGWTPLHWLCRYCKKTKLVDFVDFLLIYGADVRAKTKEGETPLHLLCQYSSNENLIEIAQLLIERGADVNAKTKDGKTPFQLACTFNYENARLSELLKFLIEKGADVSGQNGFCHELFSWRTFRIYWFCSLILGIMVLAGIDSRADDVQKNAAFGFMNNDILLKLALLCYMFYYHVILKNL